jgi:ferredoxin
MAIEVRASASRITEACTECGVCRRFCPVAAIQDRPQAERPHEV